MLADCVLRVFVSSRDTEAVGDHIQGVCHLGGPVVPSLLLLARLELAGLISIGLFRLEFQFGFLGLGGGFFGLSMFVSSFSFGLLLALLGISLLGGGGVGVSISLIFGFLLTMLLRRHALSNCSGLLLHSFFLALLLLLHFEFKINNIRGNYFADKVDFEMHRVNEA